MSVCCQHLVHLNIDFSLIKFYLGFDWYYCYYSLLHYLCLALFSLLDEIVVSESLFRLTAVQYLLLFLKINMEELAVSDVHMLFAAGSCAAGVVSIRDC
jgi:hypothetical protein